MNLERERRLNELLVSALALDPRERRGYILAEAADDLPLAEDILEALDHEVGGFLEEPAALTVESVTPSNPSRPLHIGPYSLGERLGAGGMGEVFRALQEQPVRREVALKVVRAFVRGKSKERFLSEQRALARLSHSHIARFYESGTTEDGQPWFAMELIEGEPITTYCDTRSLSVEARLKVFLGVCVGVEHAHQKQILHRDLKPSNVLVVEEDGVVIPKIIDFGIAKALDGRLGDATVDTTQALLGTPAYMSQEALSSIGGSEELDTRSDIFSLGVLLSELLTDRRPYDDDGSGLLELLRQREEQEPLTPSQRLRALGREETGEVARRRSTTSTLLERTIAKDLDWIVAKAVAPDRARRYGSAGALASDVRRFLSSEPVRARPPTASYLLSKFLRRHRVPVSATVLGLAIGAVGLTSGLIQAQREAESTRRALTEAREVSSFLVSLFEVADPTRSAEDLSAQELLARGAEEIPNRFVNQPAARGRFLQTIADVYVEMGHYDQAEPMLMEASDLLSATLGPKNSDHTSVQHSLGVLQIKRRAWSDAEASFQEVLANLDPAQDPENWARAQHDLGIALFRQRRHDEAQNSFQRALRVREQTLELDHPQMAESFNALGAVLLSKRRPEQALPHFQRSLAHRVRNLGKDHPHTAQSLQNIGRVHRQMGDLEKARLHFLRVLEIEEQALGPEHPELIRPLFALGDLYLDQNELAEAERMRRWELKIREKAQGDDPLAFAKSLLRLADLLFERGSLAEAETLYGEGFELYDRLYAPDNPFRNNPQLGLAMIAWKRGHLEQAEKGITEYITTFESLRGTTHVGLAYPLRGLAGIARNRGQIAEAQHHFCRALRLYEKSHPGGAQFFEGRLRLDFAAMLTEVGRANEAADLETRGFLACPITSY